MVLLFRVWFRVQGLAYFCIFVLSLGFWVFWCLGQIFFYCCVLDFFVRFHGVGFLFYGFLSRVWLGFRVWANCVFWSYVQHLGSFSVQGSSFRVIVFLDFLVRLHSLGFLFYGFIVTGLVQGLGLGFFCILVLPLRFRVFQCLGLIF